jgi:nitrite reductase/ring-hydroxylating ferredoxin subunit
MAEEKWVTVAKAGSIEPGDIVGVAADGTEIAVYNVDGTLYATGNICTHAMAFLSDGWLDGDVIECPLHAGRFEVKTGKALGPPVDCDIQTYPVRIVGDEVQVKVEG